MVIVVSSLLVLSLLFSCIGSKIGVALSVCAGILGIVSDIQVLAGASFLLAFFTAAVISIENAPMDQKYTSGSQR
ncbi:hypothetical protein FZ983_27465 [Azospirillum sp. B21]|uniref:hypothetical protein n=1 Tax=Azospirillum sp. B21 TaxID=2607496 RepID=UPI0011F034C0|nr:hypothetical protein [Azospirillum sp. B21]KAA0574640.1 hypothetical protein FZ983_27465 [Azospirillum sp. B21]